MTRRKIGDTGRFVLRTLEENNPSAASVIRQAAGEMILAQKTITSPFDGAGILGKAVNDASTAVLKDPTGDFRLPSNFVKSVKQQDLAAIRYLSLDVLTAVLDPEFANAISDLLLDLAKMAPEAAAARLSMFSQVDWETLRRNGAFDEGLKEKFLNVFSTDGRYVNQQRSLIHKWGLENIATLIHIQPVYEMLIMVAAYAAIAEKAWGNFQGVRGRIFLRHETNTAIAEDMDALASVFAIAEQTRLQKGNEVSMLNEKAENALKIIEIMADVIDRSTSVKAIADISADLALAMKECDQETIKSQLAMVEVIQKGTYLAGYNTERLANLGLAVNYLNLYLTCYSSVNMMLFALHALLTELNSAVVAIGANNLRGQAKQFTLETFKEKIEPIKLKVQEMQLALPMAAANG